MEKPWLKSYAKETAKEINPNEYPSILELFNESVKKYHDRTAYICMGSSLSFSELDELSAQFASFLQNKAGLKKGDRIALQMPNLLQYPVALFGALRAGLAIVNTNPLYTAPEMKHQFKDSGVKAIVILANFASHLEKIIHETEIKTVVVTQLGDLLGFPKSLLVNSVVKYIKKMVPKYNLDGHFQFLEALDLGTEKPFTPVTTKPEDIAFLQYTGGTTGVAKGAVLSHRNVISNMLQIREWMKPRLKDAGEIIVTALPLYHIFSLTVNCLSFMCAGNTNLLITNPKDIPGFIKILRKNKFTVVAGVNTLFNALMNHPDFAKINFTQTKLSVAGAMALQTAVAERWTKLTNTPIVEGYGLTEASPVVCCNPINGTGRTGTIGLPVSSTDVKLIDDNEQEVKPGEAGELCVRGPQVMQGYWNNAAETAKIMTNDGWLKTGDVAQMDAQGFFKIVDRKKDMILVSGFNVYPNEIEDVIATHPGVLEVAAVGIPNEHSGEVVKIFVVRRGGTTPVTADELIAHAKKSLTGYKIPKQVEFRNELPKTNVGKILRRALRDEKPANA